LRGFHLTKTTRLVYYTVKLRLPPSGCILPYMTRVRFAPAPTGYLHIGGVRTYIFNWLFARQTGGKIVLRIDDTDTERSTKEAIKSLISELLWLELPWDEEYYQSQVPEVHKKAAEKLLASGHAYRDFTPKVAPESGGAQTGDKQIEGSLTQDTPAEDTQTGDMPAGDTPSHNTQSSSKQAGPWLSNAGMRELSKEESDRRAATEPFVVRFRVPRESGRVVAFKDLVYGDQSRKIEDMEDFALLRSDGSATCHLASCVDDVELEISHVIRGQDHLTNTFKHILMFEALDFQMPTFGHLPLLMGPDGSKLSKGTHGPVVSLTSYRDRGMLARGLMNYLCLLGWSPKDDREVFTPEELEKVFSIEGIPRTNAVVSFDEADDANWADPKALWINGQHLRSIDLEDLVHYVEKEFLHEEIWKPEYVGEGRDWLIETIDLLRPRFTTIRDFVEKGRAYFSDEFEIEPKALKNLDKEGARDLLHELAPRLAALAEFNEENVEKEISALAEERGVKAGLITNGARAALTGQSVGPSALAVFVALGQERVVARLRFRC